MSDIQEKILELMDLFDDDEVTTANKIPRPQSSLDKEAFDDFNIRNPLAGGGMLVQPSADGRRPGYSIASEKVINFAKKFKEKNEDLPTQQEIMKGTGAGSSTIKRHLKEGVDFKKVLSPGETSAIAGKKSGEKKKIESGVIAPDDKEGLKKLQTKVNKLNRVNNLKNKGIKFKIVKTQAGNFTTELSYLADAYRKKLNKTKSQGPLKNLIEEFNKFRKTDLFKNYDLGTVMREAGIKSGQTQLKNLGSKKKEIFDYLLQNKNSTIEDLAKNFKLKEGVVRRSLQGLYTDIYKKYAGEGAAYIGNVTEQSLRSVHNSIKNTKVQLKDRVRNLVIDAYKGDKNLKPLLDKLDQFYALQNEIKKTPYGKFFAANLDHPVPLNFIRQLDEGADPFNLIRVRPMPEFLNQRAFKSQFDRVLGTAYRTGNKKALEAIVNLQSYLPQEFGGITPDGKIIDYGAKPFSLKTDLSQSNFGDIYKRVFEFIKNPDLQDTFRESKVSFKNLLSQEKNIMKQSQSINNLLLKLSAQIDSDCAGAIKQASKDGGRIGLKTIGSQEVCITKAKNYMNETLQRGIGTETNVKTSLIKRILSGTANFLKQNLSPKEIFKLENLIGKPALYGAAAFETGFVADDVLRKGKPLNVAAAESLFGDLLNLDADAARAKNLLESNVQLSPAAKEYAQNILDYDRYRKNELSLPASLIAKKMPGSDRYFKMQEDLRNKIENTPDTGAMDYMSALNESEGAFKAKPKFLDAPDKPDITPLTNKFANPPGTRIGPMTAKRDMQIDLSLPTYDRSFTASDEELNQYLKSIGETPLEPGEGTLFRMREPDQRGLFGTQERFADGGLSGGDKSGPPPESGPTPHGLPGILKRVKNI